MKRIAVALCILAVMLYSMFISGCGDKYADSEFIGTWKCTTGEMEGVSVDVEDVIGPFVVTLEKDGKAYLEIAGGSSSDEWSPVDGGFEILNGDEELKFAKDGQFAVLERSGITMKFEKE